MVKKSAEQGNAQAQYSLALTYFNYNGLALSIDKKKAAVWMNKAYLNGWEEAKEMWNKLELWKYEK